MPIHGSVFGSLDPMGRDPRIDGIQGLTDRSSGSNVPSTEAVPQVVMEHWSPGKSLKWDVGPFSLDGSSVLCLPLVWKSGIIPSGS